MSDEILNVNDLHKSFQMGREMIEVIKGVTFKIKGGQMVSLAGASGAGKSTLLHIVGTLDAPTKGEVFFEGESLFRKTEKNLAAFRNEKIGFVFQFHHLLPEFTALENVMMPGLISGLRQSEIIDRAKEKLDEMGLSHRIKHRPGELSGGEQQRVAIARALILRPHLLLADELTGNLDTKTGQQIIDLLLKLNQKYNMTMIVATHNESLAATLPVHFKMADGRLNLY